MVNLTIRKPQKLDRHLRYMLDNAPIEPKLPLVPLLQADNAGSYLADLEPVRRKQNHRMTAFAILNGLGSTSAVIALCNFIAFPTFAGNPGVINDGGITITVLAALASIPSLLHHRRDSAALKTIAIQRFTRWANARYGIWPDTESLNQVLVDALVRGGVVGWGYQFFAQSGDRYDLIIERDGSMVVEPQLSTTVQYRSPREVPAVAATELEPLVPLTDLTGEMAVLYGRLRDVLTRLQGRSLSIENEHVIKRVIEDVRQVMSTQSQMLALGALPETATRSLTRTLALLVDEATQVLNFELESLVSDAAAQELYVAERQAVTTSTELSLTPGPKKDFSDSSHKQIVNHE